MKVAILGTKYSPPHFKGGDEQIIHAVSRTLQARGWQVDIFTPKLKRWSQIDARSAGGNVTRIPVSDIPFFYNLQFAQRLPRFLRGGGYDVILTMYTPLGIGLEVRPHLVNVQTTAIGETGAIVTNGLKHRLERLLRRTVVHRVERRVLADCDHVMCPSEHIAGEVHRGFGVPRRRISIIGNGVDSEYYRPLRSTTASAGTTLRIRYVGRLANRKNVDLLIRAGARLAATGTDFQILVAGEGDERSHLESLARRLGVDGRVCFLGHLVSDELIAAYQSSDVVVLPSRYEGMPLALLEALACGVPCIAAPFAGASDVVDNGANGYVLGDYSEEELCARLQTLATDVELRARMGRRARQIAIERFSWDRVADRYAALFSAVCKRRESSLRDL